MTGGPRAKGGEISHPTPSSRDFTEVADFNLLIFSSIHRYKIINKKFSFKLFV